jgi:hypothetical protein
MVFIVRRWHAIFYLSLELNRMMILLCIVLISSVLNISDLVRFGCHLRRPCVIVFIDMGCLFC